MVKNLSWGTGLPQLIRVSWHMVSALDKDKRSRMRANDEMTEREAFKRCSPKMHILGCAPRVLAASDKRTGSRNLCMTSILEHSVHTVRYRLENFVQEQWDTIHDIYCITVVPGGRRLGRDHWFGGNPRRHRRVAEGSREGREVERETIEKSVLKVRFSSPSPLNSNM